MTELPNLSDMGNRIIILGPTNAGKSTLAVAMANRLGVTPIHLDIMRHLPGTDWVQRSDADFAALHDAAIAKDGWVMDGNYTALMPQRLQRATSIIVIDEHFLRRYLRYFKRTLFEGGKRAGGLEGGRDSVKWAMIIWVWKTRNAEKYRAVARDSGLVHVICRTEAALNALYAHWGLER